MAEQKNETDPRLANELTFYSIIDAILKEHLEVGNTWVSRGGYMTFDTSLSFPYLTTLPVDLKALTTKIVKFLNTNKDELQSALAGENDGYVQLKESFDLEGITVQGFQLFNREDVNLDMSVQISSADILNGLPRGLAYIGLLQLALAKWGDLATAGLILNMGNAYIYNDTTDRAKALLSAEISLPPEVFMKKIDIKKAVKSDDFFINEG